MALSLRFAARSDVGLLRDGNEDSAYAGPHLLVVADGMGGEAAGEVASSVAVATLSRLDDDMPQGDLLAALGSAVDDAQKQLRFIVQTQPSLAGMGTTLTALLRTGSRLGLAHLGDSRAYLLRDDTLEQITRDHTLVQGLVDAGRINEDEAFSHPKRNLITRALDGVTDVEPDLSLRELRAGDRLLLCSDGLSGVVSAETMHDALRSTDEAATVADALIDLALRGGAPDNVTCIVADVVDDDGAGAKSVAVGAVSQQRSSHLMQPQDTPASRAAALRGRVRSSETSMQKRRRRWPILLALLALLVGVFVGATLGWYVLAQRQYYVGTDNGTVAIYRGPAQELFGVALSRVVEPSTVLVADLPRFEQSQLLETIPARSRTDAQDIVARLDTEATACRTQKPTPSDCPTTATAGSTAT